MQTDQATLEKVFSHIDREELARLAMDVVSIPTPTGSEEEVARFIHDWLQKQGIETFLQHTEPGRANVVGVIPGDGAPVRRCSSTGTWTRRWRAPRRTCGSPAARRPEWQALARREDDVIYGSGIVNDKGPLTCTLVNGQGAQGGAASGSRATSSSPAWPARSAARRWTTTRAPPTAARGTARATW